jgi:RNA polymerase sigma-B factor
MSSIDDEILLRRYAASREPADLEALVVRYRPLALSLAHRYAHGPAPHEDLEQVACLGLVKALQRFEPSRGFAFTSFAVPTIAGELRRWHRDTAWAAHVPRRMQERVLEARAAGDRLAAERGRAATAGDVADALTWATEEVVEARCAAEALAPVPLDAPPGSEAAGPQHPLGVEEPGFELAEGRAVLERALRGLTSREREILRLRYDEDLTHEGIARRLDTTAGSVAHALARTVAHLAELAGEAPGHAVAA